MKAAIIAAPMTGSGKTTVTLGLLASLRQRGFAVQPFKIGPDFIDAGLHGLAAGTPSHNLDGWMLSREMNLALFENATRGKDVAIVEGVMGLFDGFDGRSNSGSTAEMATWLNLPIILVIDANPLARSVAALIHGFQTFNPQLKFAGVIFNRVAGEGHFRILSDATTTMPVLGWLPAEPTVEIPERHLGLMTGAEPQVKAVIQSIGDFFTAHLDVAKILEVLPAVPEIRGRTPELRCASPNLPASRSRPRVALAHDAAFSFYYQANRLVLELAGAEIIEFSPIDGEEMPEADFLYIGGGYPELYRHKLAANVSMKNSIRRFIESGKRFYAECGGLMYLSRRIEDSEMVGILPTDIRMTPRPVDFGYCEVSTTQASILGPEGTRLRGHQFHYSECAPSSATPVYVVTQGPRQYNEGWILPNGIASYVHLHFLSNPGVVPSVLESIFA